MTDATRLLNAAAEGDLQAAAQLLPVVYDELRRLAAQKLAREKAGQTLDATALVHEAYLRLVGEADEQRWRNRRHFFAAAAEAMFRILVENARHKASQKAGGGLVRREMNEDCVAAPQADDHLLALEEALNRLAAHDPLKAELVKLRYFAGLSADQAASVLGISPSSADRHWTFARAWLRRAMTDG